MTKLYAILIFVLLGLNLVQAQEKPDIGSFDIEKVSSAVAQGSRDTSFGQATSLVQQKAPESYYLVMLRVIGYLGLIIVLIFGVAWLVRKVGIAGTSKMGGGGSMDVLEVLPLGQNRNVVLVRVMDSVYLIGQTVNSISVLEKIDGQKAIDLISSTKGGTSIMQFKDAFNSFIGKIKK